MKGIDILDTKTINSINKKVAQRFPEVARAKPKVQQQTGSGKNNSNFLLIYKANVKGPGGEKIRRNVRVVATTKGKIIKMTTSR